MKQKILIVLIIFSFGFPSNHAQSLNPIGFGGPLGFGGGGSVFPSPVDIAGAIWDIFLERVITNLSDRSMGNVEYLIREAEEMSDRGHDDYIDELNTILDNDMRDIFLQQSLVDVIVGGDSRGLESGSSESGLILDPSTPSGDSSSELLSESDWLSGINIEDQTNQIEILNRMVDEIMRELVQTGFFEFWEETYGYTEEEFRRMILNIYMQNVISPVINPITNTFTGTQDDLTYSISPRYPRPGDTISIRLESFAVNLDASDIEWFHNNSSLLRGLGAKTLENFQLDKSGQRETFRVFVRKNTGGIIQQVINIRPANVDIIHESNTYIPPFYEGKPEYSHGSMVKFVAIPSVLDDNGRQMSTREFTYRWYVNNQIVPESNRVGKNYFYFEDDFSGRQIDVSVNVRGIESDFNTLSKITITPRDPDIVLYEENPKYGAIFNRALTSNIETSEREISIRAVPYYFSRDQRLNFSWFLNNRELSGFNDEIVTFRSDSGDTLLSNLSVKINHPTKLAQSAYDYFSLLVNK